MRAVCAWRSTSSNPARAPTVASAFESWQSPPASVGTTQPPRSSRPCTKPRHALGRPSWRQKLSRSPAGTSMASKAARATRRFCTLPATSANSSSRPSVHSGLLKRASTGASASASAMGQRRAEGRQVSRNPCAMASNRERSQKSIASMRRGGCQACTLTPMGLACATGRGRPRCVRRCCRSSARRSRRPGAARRCAARPPRYWPRAARSRESGRR